MAPFKAYYVAYLPDNVELTVVANLFKQVEVYANELVSYFKLWLENVSL